MSGTNTSGTNRLDWIVGAGKPLTGRIRVPGDKSVSHRAIMLNAMSLCTMAVLGLSSRDTVLPVVPMFHINAWCLPYAALIGGAKLVLPGKDLDGASLHTLIEAEGVTLSAGVPTVWLALLASLGLYAVVGLVVVQPGMDDRLQDGDVVYVRESLF